MKFQTWKVIRTEDDVQTLSLSDTITLGKIIAIGLTKIIEDQEVINIPDNPLYKMNKFQLSSHEIKVAQTAALAIGQEEVVEDAIKTAKETYDKKKSSKGKKRSTKSGKKALPENERDDNDIDKRQSEED